MSVQPGILYNDAGNKYSSWVAFLMYYVSDYDTSELTYYASEDVFIPAMKNFSYHNEQDVVYI